MSKNTTKFRSKYDGLSDVVTGLTGTVNLEPSLTDQSGAESSDINWIMERFARTGVLEGNRLPPQYADVSAVPDYMTALNTVLDAEERFSTLPSRVRDRFHNDPVELLRFLSDEANRAEAEKLGLLAPSIKAEDQTPPGVGSNTDPIAPSDVK